jgi:hypothetical protein
MPTSKKMLASVLAGVVSEKIATAKPQLRMRSTILVRKSPVPVTSLAVTAENPALRSIAFVSAAMNFSRSSAFGLSCIITKAVLGRG